MRHARETILLCLRRCTSDLLCPQTEAQPARYVPAGLRRGVLVLLESLLYIALWKKLVFGVDLLSATNMT